MHLKSLEIAGFKSFAKKTELTFTTSITGIVGPNGSGKSNVAESFRFVLGEQSIKSMRGKRGEDLIFNGSPAVARANRASVKIVLDNQKRIFPLDFDEVAIERIVHRDGENEYLINGSRVRLKDVQELLASANIGASGHHIISQGEADRILSAGPRERREMIEDALGLKVYQYKRAESEKKLAKTRENIAHVESLRKEVAPHLKFLERQMKKMEKALNLRTELSDFYAAYLFREEAYVKYHRERLRAARETPERELKELEGKLAEAKAKMAAAEKNENHEELFALEEKIREARDRRQAMVRDIGKLEGQLSALERMIHDAERRRDTSAAASVPLQKVEEVVRRAEKDAAGAKSADLAGMRAIVDGLVRMLRSFLNDASRAGSAEETSVAEYEKEHEGLTKEKQALEAELARIEGVEATLRNESNALRESMEVERVEGREAEREVFAIMSRERDLEQLLADLDREAREIARDEEEFTREVQEAIVLVGRAAADYVNKTVRDEHGAAVTKEVVLAEDRARQRERRHELERMKIRLEELGAAGGEEVAKEYEDAKARDEFLSREITDLEASVASLEALIAELGEELNTQFVAGIEKISEEFNRFFGMMFGGGTAALVRVVPKVRKRKTADEAEMEPDTAPEEEEEEGEEGIDIDVKLAHKRIRGLEMLSGGERALTSIALIFAMSQVSPPLFVILDETDAALDEANSRRYGDMIEALAEKSQLILITHNRETMSRAGVLYGVTMSGDGVSKLLSVKFDEALAVAK